MITIQFQCESQEEAHVYLNAQNYLNLIHDLYSAITSARKHGTDKDVLHQIEHFLPELGRAAEHNLGAY